MDNAIPRSPQAPPPPTVDEVRARIQENARIVLPRRLDRTYTDEIEKYKRWVRQHGLVREDKYITRENVDLYFTEVQQYRLVKPGTGRRVVNALQAHADIVEYAGAEVRFVVDSATVKSMLIVQKQKKIQKTLDTGKDYHVKLPVKNLTFDEKYRIIRYVLENNKIYWSDFLTTWNACNQMMCRVDSMLKMKLSDIYVDDAHTVGNLKQDLTYQFDKQMIALILRPHTHKERAEKVHVIGAYRHKDPYFCFTGCLAMNLFVHLNQQQQNINFYDEDYNINHNIRTETARSNSEEYREPRWSQIRLLRTWANQKAAHTTYSQVLEDNNVEWEKVTHLRKAAVEEASTGGLDRQSIGTMSKHQTETGTSKLSTAYCTELLPSVMLWASGYDKNDIHSYNNPRTRLQLPIINNNNNNNNTDTFILSIFPQIQRWKEEQADRARGDNRECARHFVNVVLPLLAMVVIQDGIYWVTDYPNNLPSRLLLEKMQTIFPGYARWAQQARREIDQQARAVGQVQVDTLNAVAQRAFNMMVGKIDSLQQQQVHQQAQQQQVLNVLQQQHQQQQQHMQELLQQQQQQFQQQQQQLEQRILQQQQQIQQLLQQREVQQQRHNNNNNNNNIDNDDYDNDNNNNNDDDNEDNNNNNNNHVDEQAIVVPIVPIVPMHPPPPPRLIYNIDQIVVPHNINDALQNAPMVPPIPTQLPQSMHDLVVQHYDLKLENYNHSCKAHWPSNIQQAFSKRKYLFNYVYDKAARLRGPDTLKTKMHQMATRLDTERGDLSMDKFMNMVRNADPNRKRRRPRQQQQQPQP
jgi:hypothetical protein